MIQQHNGKAIGEVVRGDTGESIVVNRYSGLIKSIGNETI